MLKTIWQYIHNDYARRRFGLDNADVQHIRADLRFRLALVEYAYFGRSGKKVARSLAELKSLLGDRAIHKYLRSLDPDLRTQFVERFQSRRRDAGLSAQLEGRDEPAAPGFNPANVPEREAAASVTGHRARFGSNVVPINTGSRRTVDPQAGGREPGHALRGPGKPHSVESSE